MLTHESCGAPEQKGHRRLRSQLQKLGKMVAIVFSIKSQLMKPWDINSQQ